MIGRPRGKHKKLKVLLSIREDVWKLFADMCDQEKTKFSHRIETLIKNDLKKYYNGALKLEQ